MANLSRFLSEYNVILGTLVRGLAFLFLMVVAYLSKQVLEDVRDIKNMLANLMREQAVQQEQIEYLAKTVSTHSDKFAMQDENIKDFYRKYGYILKERK